MIRYACVNVLVDGVPKILCSVDVMDVEAVERGVRRIFRVPTWIDENGIDSVHRDWYLRYQRYQQIVARGQR